MDMSNSDLPAGTTVPDTATQFVDRRDCIMLALNAITASKLLEMQIVVADDLGPYVCETAEYLYQYMITGIVPPYKSLDNEGSN